MKLRAVLLAGLVALSATPATAYLVKGNIQCPDILTEDSNATYSAQNAWWVLGYISAMNRANDVSRGEDVDSDAIYAMLLDYCRANPDKDIDDASFDIFSRLR